MKKQVISFKINLKPISANQQWLGRKWKTKLYQSWEEEALWALKNIKQKIDGEFFINLIFYLPDYRKRDLDNCIKPILDILKKREIIEDDRYCKEIHAKKIKNKDYKISIVIKKL